MTSKRRLESRFAELRGEDGEGLTREQLAEAWREGLRPADEREPDREGEGEKENDE